jgi:DNA-binding CsgD family transcriptional regulator
MTIKTTIGGIETELIEWDKLTKPVTVGDIDTIVGETIVILDRNSYHHERKQYNECVIYEFYYKDAFMGTVDIMRRDTDKRDDKHTVKYWSNQCSSDPELKKSWEQLVYGLFYVDIARKIESRDAKQARLERLAKAIVQKDQRDFEAFFGKPILDMLDARAMQPEIRNDPVLDVALENYIKTEPIKTGEAWHNGNTLSETPTSGSVIQLPGGEIIRAEKMTSPYDAQAAPVMQAQSPKRITANQKEKQERQVKVKRYCEQGMSIAEMARTENVSEATIKRDLRELRMTTRQ